jgi:NAD(P)-dependent dehydrogenase (short-subunit alcohol dehydrogenase family)
MMQILITGTSSGIGYGLAKTFLERGDQVFGISRREPKDLKEMVNYQHLNLDLTDTKSVEEKLPVFLTNNDYFDLVVLNSGVLGEIKLMKEVSQKEMKEVMEINVWANKVLLDLIFAMDIKVKQVVGISSGAALRSTPGWGSYSLSKAALDMLMNIYAKEYPKTHFCGFAPGLVDSEIQEYIYNMKDAEKYPSAKKLQDARYTEMMPDAITAAPMLIDGMEKALQYESGSHVDVRERLK